MQMSTNIHDIHQVITYKRLMNLIYNIFLLYVPVPYVLLLLFQGFILDNKRCHS